MSTQPINTISVEFDALLTPAALVAVHPAKRYLNALFHKNDTVCLTFVSATKKYRNGKSVVKNEFLPLSEVLTDASIERLTERNNRDQIYVSMAPFRPDSETRTKDNIAEVRHVFIEADKNGDAVLAAVRAAAVADEIPAPTFIVQSSPHKYHFIWNVVGFTVPVQETVNRTLAQKFSTDTQAVDAARVLRIPGFRNIKAKYSDPKPVAETVEYNEPPPQGITIHDFKIPLASERPAVSIKPAKPRTDDPLAKVVDAISDEKLLKHIRESKQGEKVSKLMGGECPDGYFDASNSLCAILAWWTRGNPERIDRIYKTSRLYTDSPEDGGPDGPDWWAEPVEGSLTRGGKTIARSCALAAANGMYDPTTKGKPPCASETFGADYKIIASLARKLGTENTAVIESEIARRYPERYRDQNEKHGERQGETYWHYSVVRYFERRKGAGNR